MKSGEESWTLTWRWLVSLWNCQVLGNKLNIFFAEWEQVGKWGSVGTKEERRLRLSWHSGDGVSGKWEIMDWQGSLHSVEFTLHTTHTHSTLQTKHTLCICKYTDHALHNGQWTLNLGNWTVYRRSCSYNTFEGQDTSNLGRCRSYYTLKGQNRGSLLNGVCILSNKSCLWIDWWKYPNLFSLSIHFIRKCITEVFIVFVFANFTDVSLVVFVLCCMWKKDLSERQAG